MKIEIKVENFVKVSVVSWLTKNCCMYKNGVSGTNYEEIQKRHFYRRIISAINPFIVTELTEISKRPATAAAHLHEEVCQLRIRRAFKPLEGYGA